MSKVIPVLFVATAFAACAEQPPPSSAVVRDSAGIRIVENTAPMWEEGQAWHLSTEPVVDIGAVSGDPNYELFRVGSAVRLDDGRFVIANNGTQELRFYDSNGVHLLTAGGPGGGPGEFKRLTWVHRFRGDSLIAYQWYPPRSVVFDNDGRVQREIPQDQIEGRRGMVVGVTDEGGFLASVSTAPGGEPEGLVRDTMILYYKASDDSPWASVAEYLGTEMVYQHFPQGFTFDPPLFARMTGIAVHGDRFHLAATDLFEIKTYSVTGMLEMVTRRHVPVREVRQAHVEMLLGERLEKEASADDAFRRLKEKGMRETAAATLPAFGLPSTRWEFALTSPIHVEEVWNLWVRESHLNEEDQSQWSVFDSAGMWQGQVAMPVGLIVLNIGSEYVLGLWRDADDVEHVRMYELVKP